MDWLEQTQNHRKVQTQKIAESLGYFQKAEDDVTEEESDGTDNSKNSSYDGKSDMFKMRMLGLRQFNEQDHKVYIGVEDVKNSYISNQENGDILICKIKDGYLVSMFPVDIKNKEGEEKEASDLSSAIDIALLFKDDLDNEEEPEQIMYKQ